MRKGEAMKTQEFTFENGLRSYCVNGEEDVIGHVIEVTASAGECADDEAEGRE